MQRWDFQKKIMQSKEVEGGMFKKYMHQSRLDLRYLKKLLVVYPVLASYQLEV